MMPPCPNHLTTVAHQAPVLVDRLERMLKVLRNPPNVMGEHMPLHACACLDHACRVRLLCPRYLLICLGVHHLPIFNPTSLYLLVEGSAVETHVGARWLFDGAVVEMISGDRAASSSHSMTQLMWDGTLLCEVSLYCTILTPTRTSACGLGP